jgi:hypothetical protein
MKMNLNRLAVSGLLASCILLSACTQWYFDMGAHLSEQDVPDPKTDIALTQVLADLGPPQRMSATDNGYVLAWEHWLIYEQTLGLRLGFMGADLFSIDWGKARVQGDFLLLTFSRDHQLTSGTFSHWDNSAGNGTAFQPFFSPVSLVDVGDLTGIMPQHRWGFGAMKPLPRSINRDSDPETGQNGVEQRGTPPTIGQRSLEMD